MDRTDVILRDLCLTMAEACYESDDPADWSLSGDDYYDFLAGWGIGHRQIRGWVNERRAGEAVKLTRKGVVAFRMLRKEAA